MKLKDPTLRKGTYFLESAAYSDELLWGAVFNNPKFRDGEWIHTSRVIQVISDHVFETLNSIYVVLYWGDKDGPRPNS